MRPADFCFLRNHCFPLNFRKMPCKCLESCSNVPWNLLPKSNIQTAQSLLHPDQGGSDHAYRCNFLLGEVAGFVWRKCNLVQIDECDHAKVGPLAYQEFSYSVSSTFLILTMISSLELSTIVLFHIWECVGKESVSGESNMKQNWRQRGSKDWKIVREKRNMIEKRRLTGWRGKSWVEMMTLIGIETSRLL